MGGLKLFGIGVVVTSAMVISTLYYLSRNSVNTSPRSLDSDTPGTERQTDKEQQSLPNDNPDVVSLRETGRDKEQQSVPDDNSDLVFLRKFGRVKNLPTAEQMKNMSDTEIHYIYHSYLDNTDFSCKRKLRMGNPGDGGWEVCDDFRFRPIKPCVVYSFGINFDFSFDDDVGRVYGCTVHSFDPSMHRPTHRRSPQVYFYDLGISGKNRDQGSSFTPAEARKDWSLKTLTEIKAMLGHENTTVDIFKIDVDGPEWPVLEDMLQQGNMNNIRQVLIEFHYNLRPATVRKILPILQKMEASGLRRFHTHMNPLGGRSKKVFPVIRMICYEVYFVNTNLMRIAD